MAKQIDSDTELLTEHFGYAPISLLDSIINNVNTIADKTLDRVEQGLQGASYKTLGFEKAALKKQPQNGDSEPQLSVEETAKLELTDGTHKLETLLCAAIDKNFDLFELYVMRNILCVQPDHRNWVRLAHYEGLDFAERQDAPSPESVTALRRKLQASLRLNSMLQTEKAKNDQLLAQLRGALGGRTASRTSLGVKTEESGAKSTFGFLQEKGDLAEGDAQTPITTTTAFTLSQLQALRALSTSLRNIMPDLGDAEGSQEDADGRKGWRRERLEYVEAATRKHLENVRGLELGKNGEVRDGEWQGEGRKFAKGEVEGLEKVVAILGAGPEGAARKDEMDES